MSLRAEIAEQPAVVGRLLEAGWPEARTLARPLAAAEHLTIAARGSSDNAGPPVVGAEPHGSSAGALAPPESEPDEPKPPPVVDPRWVRLTLALAYFSDGPISSTCSSMTVRFSPSRVS